MLILIVILLIALFLLWSRLSGFYAQLTSNLTRNAYKIPNEILINRRSLNPEQDALIDNWLNNNQYSKIRQFSGINGVNIQLYRKQGQTQNAFIELLTGGEEAVPVTIEEPIEQLGGGEIQSVGHSRTLFPEQTIVLPTLWQVLGKRNQKIGQKDYSDKDIPMSRSQQSFQISGPKYKSQQKTVVYKDAAGEPALLVGVIDSKTNFDAFIQYQNELSESDLYLRYWNDPSNHFDWNPANLSSDGHGTMMASIIASRYDGPIKIGIKNYVFHTGVEGHMIDLIAAIYSAIHSGCRVINLSLGYPSNSINPILRDAIAYAGDSANDCVVVCAAGNNASDNDVHGYWPANFNHMDHVITVAAADDSGHLWVSGQGRGSNYGEINVQTASPGVDILGHFNSTNVGTLTGTSSAAAVLSAYATTLRAQSLQNVCFRNRANYSVSKE